MTTTTTTNTAAVETETVEAGKNDKRFSDLMKQVSKLGEEASLGRDSLPKLAHAVVKAAADGVINLDDKDDKGNDAAARLYAKYAASESKKAIHEHSAGGKKANISKLRQLIAMGCMTTIDPVQVMQDAFEAREGVLREDGVKVKSAYPFYVDVARAQVKTDTPLTKAHLEELAAKDEPNAQSLESELKRVLKVLEGLVTGENRDKIKDDDELTEAAYHAVKERLEKIELIKKTDALRAKAAELGLTIA